MKQYCKYCDIHTYCDMNPCGCPIAKEYKQMEEFEKAKEKLKEELLCSYYKMLDCMDKQLERVKKLLKGRKK